jgi:hypothetical protein
VAREIVSADVEEPIDVVLTAGDLDPAIVALRELLHATSALEAQGVVDRGDEPAALITVGRATPIEVVDGARTVHLPHAVDLGIEPPALPRVPQLPPFEIDADEGTISGALGGVQGLAEAVEKLAAELGGRSVALAFFATTDPEVPLGIAARPGEPTVLTLGDQQFTFPA